VVYAIDDRDLLPDEMNERLDEALEAGERVLVAIPGELGTGIAGTDRRVFIWKRSALQGYDYTDLSGVACSTGTVPWVQLLGPGLDDRKPTLLNLTSHAAAIMSRVSRLGGDERVVAGRLKELVEGSTTVAPPDTDDGPTLDMAEGRRAFAGRFITSALRTAKTLGTAAVGPDAVSRTLSSSAGKTLGADVASLPGSEDAVVAADTLLELPCAACGRVSSTYRSSASLECPSCERTYSFLTCSRCESANQVVTPVPRLSRVRCAFCGSDQLSALTTAGLRWEALERHHLLDSSAETVLVGAFTILGGAGLGLEAGSVCSLLTSPACLRLNVEVGEPRALEIGYGEITALELSGEDKDYAGLNLIGFGLDQIAAAALTTLFRISTVNTGMRIATVRGELHLHNGQWAPDVLRVMLSPLWTRFEQASQGVETEQASGAPTSEDVELLGQLASLHATGVLTDEEFAAKKAELLERM
jgi:hypothetical protein